jgi:poly(hydroxyalkanoate) depolymerase family esterase
MNAINTGLKEAARLVRVGRLEDALTTIRKSLGVHEPGRSAAPGAGMRSGAASGDRRSLPNPESPAKPPRQPDERVEADLKERQSSPFPGSMRSLLDGIGQLGALRGLDGLDRSAGTRAPPLPLPDGARFEERDFANEAGRRAYKLYIPSSYTGQPLPLVVMLHGCTQSPDDFAAGTRMNEIAEERSVIVVYPAQARTANASKCWNWFNAADQQRGRGEPSLIAGITRQVMRDVAVDPARVYVAGLSAGGAAAAVMSETYPDLFAAVGVHSGLACGAARDMNSAFTAMRQGPATAGSQPSRNGSRSTVPTIIFHGDGDTTVNPANGHHIAAQSKHASELREVVTQGEAPGGLRYTRTVQADEEGRSLMEHWVLHGAGHAWSGGSMAGSYTEPRGPDASREMVRFFLAHARVSK